MKSFPNAKIYLSPEEAKALKLEGDNIVKVDFKDGAYHNFEKSEKIAEDIYLISAPGHTLGNSIVIAEKGGLFYMIHGDVTYTDAALIEGSNVNGSKYFIYFDFYCGTRACFYNAP